MKEEIVSFNGLFESVGTNHIETTIQRLQELMESEIVNKQQTIELLQSEIIRIRKELAAAQETTKKFLITLQDAERNAEGNRQLVNKLLNDIERMQQDIEWYKRTYERRSLLGALKEKLFK